MSSSIWKARAMLIEPSLEHATKLRAIFAKAGVEVTEWAKSGTGWIAQWQINQPEIMVIEVLLPRRDGFFCIEKLKQLDPHSHIIFTHSYTGLMANDVELKALSLGASSVLQKPFVESRVLVSVDRLLGQLTRKTRMRKVKT